MYRGLLEVAGVMGGGLWCPLTAPPLYLNNIMRQQYNGSIFVAMLVDSEFEVEDNCH